MVIKRKIYILVYSYYNIVINKEVMTLDLGDIINDYKKKEVVDAVKEYNKSEKKVYQEKSEKTD